MRPTGKCGNVHDESGQGTDADDRVLEGDELGRVRQHHRHVLAWFVADGDGAGRQPVGPLPQFGTGIGMLTGEDAGTIQMGRGDGKRGVCRGAGGLPPAAVPAASGMGRQAGGIEVAHAVIPAHGRQRHHAAILELHLRRRRLGSRRLVGRQEVGATRA
jgi:hypothetical protein